MLVLIGFSFLINTSKNFQLNYVTCKKKIILDVPIYFSVFFVEELIYTFLDYGNIRITEILNLDLEDLLLVLYYSIHFYIVYFFFIHVGIYIYYTHIHNTLKY